MGDQPTTQSALSSPRVFVVAQVKGQMTIDQMHAESAELNQGLQRGKQSSLNVCIVASTIIFGRFINVQFIVLTSMTVDRTVNFYPSNTSQNLIATS